VRLVYWLAALVVALAVALFAANNGERVQVILWPFRTLETPVYLLALLALLLGFLMGALIAWASGRHRRHEVRRRGRRIESLERDLGPVIFDTANQQETRDRIKRWRQRAEELRTAADQFREPSAQEPLRRAAGSYDQMADFAEVLLDRKPMPPAERVG